MRFETLHLERYGHFTGSSLDLSGDEVRLHIVHGRNEAGKSTILSALSDLLFGFPAQTTFNFLHAYDAMRIGATIVSRSGERLSFKRRKGNSRTLLASDGAPLPDGALVPFLGDADRSLFETMFGLDHGRLREAGKRMLESDGDLGRSLFEAGSGLGGVDRVLASLQEALNTLGTPKQRATTKPLWRAADDFAEAQKTKRERALRHEEFRAAEQALADAVAAKAKVNEELLSIRERRSRLERTRRAGPVLIEIDRLTRELAAFADVPDLPAGFEAERLRRAETLRATENAVGTARATKEALARELAAIPADDTFTRCAAEIVALQTRLGEYLKGVADEPKLARDIMRFDDEIGRLVASLGIALGPDEVAARIPSKPLAAKIRKSMQDGAVLRAKLDKASDELAQARKDLAAAEDDRARLEGIADPAAADSLLEAVARQGDVAANLAKHRLAGAKAARDLDEAVARLDGWSAGTAALAATNLPAQETILDHEHRCQKLEITTEAASRRLAEASAELRDISAGVATLAAAGEIPTAEAVAAARDRRDALWHALRRIEIERPGEPGTSESERDTDLVSRYETSVRQADELADRRASDAQRIATFAELTGRRDRVLREQEDDRATIDALARELEALSVEWTALWAAVGMKADTPAAMRSFLAAKDEALRLLAAKRHADDELALAADAEARARERLLSAARTLGIGVDPESAFDEIDQKVRAAAEARASDWTRRLAAEESARRLRRALEEKSDAVASLEQALQAWMDDWSSLVRDLSCSAGAEPDEASVVVEIWDQIRDPLTKRADTVRRLEGLRADTARFRDDLGRLVGSVERLASERGGSLGLDADADPSTRLQALGQRLEEEKLRLARREDVAKRHEAAIHAADTADADLEAARFALDELRRLHGTDQADLESLGRRATEKRAIVESLRTRREDLAKAGEGFDEDALREQCSSCSPDVARAEIEDLLARESALVQEGQEAAQAEARARQALDLLYAKTGAAEADATGRDAALAFAGHAERWLLLETARQLLVRAIDRYRLENQDPMITRASELLARIAARAHNPIIRLGVEYRDGKVPEIVAWRSDDRACEVKHLSEGTRDQLFLCLRIAAIELYAKEREPLPFFADDLFVTSDDDRVVPGLAALAELGRTTQVLLFTHHRHVVEAARTLPPGTARVHELAGLTERSKDS
jgi:chromosome segregation protein